LHYAYKYTYSQSGGYDDAVPNKTIYVSEADLPLFQRAQELAGGNLSQAISRGLRRLVELEEGRLEGFDEVTVRVGPGKGRRQRFMGVLLVDWARSSKEREEKYHVYRSRTGKIVLHVEHSPEYFHRAGPDGKATGWRKHLSADQQWGTTPASASLEVFDTVEELRPRVPTELFDLVAAAAAQPEVEDLDI
jgi:EXLDI family protein